MILFDWFLIAIFAVALLAPPDYFDYILIGLCVVIVFSPTKYDPAIRMKEFNMRWRARLENRK